MEASDTPTGNLDMMIAAQALAAEATLVTHDRVCRRVKGLKLEDWTNRLKPPKKTTTYLNDRCRPTNPAIWKTSDMPIRKPPANSE